jgi:integrase
LDELDMHDLRHVHVSVLIDQGEHPKVIAERLGHVSVRTVLDVYGHLFPGTDEETAARLDERLRAAQGGHKPATADVVDLPRRDKNPD